MPSIGSLCLFVSILSTTTIASAATTGWGLDFDEEKLAPTSPDLFVAAGAETVTLLHVDQNEHCTTQTLDDEDPSCPASATLSFAALPSGVSACFVVSPTSCTQTAAIAVGSSLFVRLTTSPLLAAQTFTWRVNAVSSSATTRSTSMPVHVVPPLFDPPSPLKIYRGAAAKTVVLPLARPTGLDDSIQMSFLYEAGSPSTGITASFAPWTLSSTATSVKLSVAATRSAALGTRDVAVAARPTRQFDAIVAPFELAIVDAFNVWMDDIDVAAGTTVTAPVRVTRDSEFTGPITFSVEGHTCGPGFQVAMFGSDSIAVEAHDTTTPRTCSVSVRGTSGTMFHVGSARVTIW